MPLSSPGIPPAQLPVNQIQPFKTKSSLTGLNQDHMFGLYDRVPSFQPPRPVYIPAHTAQEEHLRFYSSGHSLSTQQSVLYKQTTTVKLQTHSRKDRTDRGTDKPVPLQGSVGMPAVWATIEEAILSPRDHMAWLGGPNKCHKPPIK